MANNKSARFLVCHWLQTLPVSNPNRDRTGAPKTTYYGGSMRGRISSQSWSRQVREAFNDRWEGDAGDRSRLWADRLAQELSERFNYERTDALTIAFLMLSATGAKADKDKAETFKAGQTDVLMFLSNNELEELVALTSKHKQKLDDALLLFRPSVAKALADGKAPLLGLEGGKKKKSNPKKPSSDANEEQPDLSDLKKEIIEKIKSTTSAADIGLFGRFFASLSNANIDGALCRAHMVTTHPVAIETDFWTAMDDLSRDVTNDDEEGTAGSGAGHLGDRPQTSGVYACSCAVDLGQLKTNLGKDGDVKKVVNIFLNSLITASRGKGYIHQFNHGSTPDLFVAELTEACPLNCLSAFEKGIETDRKLGYRERSIEQFDRWWHGQNAMLDGLVESKSVAVVEPSFRDKASNLQKYLKPSYKAAIDFIINELGDK